MDGQRWEQIEELFHAARQLPAIERDAFVDARCGGDAELRRTLLSMLQQATDSQLPESMLLPGLGQEVRSLLNQHAADHSPTVSMLVQGASVGPYQIEGPLGKGGMGEVYRARDTRLGRPVALKFLSNALAANPAILERFRREAQAISALNHPNVCTVYDVGDRAGRPYLVMELMEGQTLKQRIEERPFSNDELLAVIIPILEALEAAHATGIVHRDIKPANIFITSRGVVKILDFGLAKSSGVESAPHAGLEESLTAPGTTVGTISYMAPEQACGQDVDARSDLFACGVVLYQMATGTLPFAADGWAATLGALLHRTPRPARELRPDLSPEIEHVIDRALEKEPQARYQTATDMRAELLRSKRILESQGVPVTPTAARPPRRKAAAAVGVAGLAILGLAGWYFGSPKRPVTSASEYVQLTDFSDSVSAPALSPDGRMVTFLRGGVPFMSTDQIYVKLLPDGQSTQLTNEPHGKYDPVFTPDGAHVAYTVHDEDAHIWDTFTVPVTGGAPTRIMRNAAGMSWIGNGRILFSEIMSGTVAHMGLVTSLESRAQERHIYFPGHERAMAHYSYLSPDQKSILTVEMNSTPTWQPCRLLPMDGSSNGRPTGPNGPCTAAAWSPDGKWMYFNAAVNGATHLWRQRFPDGVPEQITHGPSEEEGVAMAPDGKSLISSVGVRKSSVWLHEASGEHVISPEGSASFPLVSADGKRVFYLLRKNTSGTNELWSTERASGKSNVALPGVSMVTFDISKDGQQVAFADSGNPDSQIFIAPLDGSAPPRLVVRGADRVSFGRPGELVFRQLGAKGNYVARIKTDGTGLARIIDESITDMGLVSPDGNWAAVSAIGGHIVGTTAISLQDGTRKKICSSFCQPRWSNDGGYLYVALDPSPSGSSVSVIIPIPRGAGLPVLPEAGFGQIGDEELPGTQTIRKNGVVPGPDAQTYAFVKSEFLGNLFRIPLH